MSADRGMPVGIVDLVIFAPIGAALVVASTTSRVVRSSASLWSPSTFCQRFFGVDKQGLAQTPTTESPSFTDTNMIAERIEVAQRVVAPSTRDRSAPPGGEASELAVEGYDHLAARQVVDRLNVLSNVDLMAIEQYERAHRHRQTVLGKIEQLLESGVESGDG